MLTGTQGKMAKLKPKIEMPSKFKGDGTDNVEKFVELYERMAPMAGWTEEDMIKFLPMALADTALAWHSTIINVTNWKV